VAVHELANASRMTEAREEEEVKEITAADVDIAVSPKLFFIWRIISKCIFFSGKKIIF
jgi:hypothetical protein